MSPWNSRGNVTWFWKVQTGTTYHISALHSNKPWPVHSVKNSLPSSPLPSFPPLFSLLFLYLLLFLPHPLLSPPWFPSPYVSFSYRIKPLLQTSLNGNALEYSGPTQIISVASGQASRCGTRLLSARETDIDVFTVVVLRKLQQHPTTTTSVDHSSFTIGWDLGKSMPRWYRVFLSSAALHIPGLY